MLLRRHRGGGLRLTGPPPCWHVLAVGRDGGGGLLGRSGSPLSWLLGQLARMHHDKPERLQAHPAVAVLHLHRPDDAVALPAARRFTLGPPRLCHEAGHGGVLASPGCEALPDGTGTRDSCHPAKPVLQTPPPGAATLGLALRHNPAHTFSAPGSTLLHRQGRCPTIAAVAIPPPKAEGEPAVPTDAEPAEYLLEIVPPVWAVSIGWPGRSRGLRLVRLRPLEDNRRGVLLEPGGRHGIDLQRFKRTGATHLSAIGRQQRSEDVPEPVIVE